MYGVCACNVGWTGSSCSVSLCTLGQYLSSAGQCVNCNTGTFSTVAGRSSCQRCSAGTFAKASGASQCNYCNAGTWSSMGASTCTACNAGTWSLQIGSSYAKQCSSTRLLLSLAPLPTSISAIFLSHTLSLQLDFIFYSWFLLQSTSIHRQQKTDIPETVILTLTLFLSPNSFGRNQSSWNAYCDAT
jgi:hypothetical protein